MPETQDAPLTPAVAIENDDRTAPEEQKPRDYWWEDHLEAGRCMLGTGMEF